LVFIDDSAEKKTLLGYEVLSFDQFLRKTKVENLFLVVAIANSAIREKLTTKCLDTNLKILNIRSQNVIVMDSVSIGSGHILSPFVTLTSDIKIGKSFQANIYSYVAHDCIIGDYVTFAPGVKCNGNVVIGDHAYLGTGAIIKQGRSDRPLTIGKKAIVGAGAMVTKSIPDGMTVFGNPAIELTKENLARRR